MCMECGEVVCCDSSTQKHAEAHVEETGHPIVIYIEPGGVLAMVLPPQQVGHQEYGGSVTRLTGMYLAREL